MLTRLRNSSSQKFFTVVKAGFSSRRKKLRSSISAGMHISKLDAEQAMERSGIDPNLRAQKLSLENWYELAKNL